MADKTRQNDDANAQSHADAAFDNVVAAFAATGAAGSDTGPTAEVTTTESITEHADSLRSTRDAQRKAQEILDLALTMRQDAAEEAEQIVLEARNLAERVTAEAERTRRETAEGVKAQREDADQIRAAAIRSAAVKAEQTRREVTEVLARGAREAQEIRSQARELLVFATDAAAGIQTSVTDALRVVEVVRSDVRDQLAVVDGLVTEVGPASAADLEAAAAAPPRSRRRRSRSPAPWHSRLRGPRSRAAASERCSGTQARASPDMQNRRPGGSTFRAAMPGTRSGGPLKERRMLTTSEGSSAHEADSARTMRIGFRSTGALLRRRRWVALVVFALTAAVVAIGVAVTEHTYTASARVTVTPKEDSSAPVEFDDVLGTVADVAELTPTPHRGRRQDERSHRRPAAPSSQGQRRLRNPPRRDRGERPRLGPCRADRQRCRRGAAGLRPEH